MKYIEPNEEEKRIMRTEAYQIWRQTEYQNDNADDVYFHTYSIALILAANAFILILNIPLISKILEPEPESLLGLLPLLFIVIFIGVATMMMPPFLFLLKSFLKTTYLHRRYEAWGIRCEVK